MHNPVAPRSQFVSTAFRTKAPLVLVEPMPTAEAVLARADMELSVSHALEDSTEARLEAVAQDASLPRAIRARALVTLTRTR